MPRPDTNPDVWVLGSSPYSAQLAGQLGRPYAFALQFGNADVDTAMRVYRESFRPSDFLSEPYSMLSVAALAQDDVAEAKRHTASAALAMLKMFQGKPYALFPPDEAAAYPATAREQNVIDSFLNHYTFGTASDVADELEQLQNRTGVNEIMLVGLSNAHHDQARSVELIADHYDMAPT